MTKRPATKAPALELTAREFAQIVRPVLPLASKNTVLTPINVVHFEVVGKWLTAGATDRFRAGIVRHELATPPSAPVAFSLRLATVRQILATFKADRYSDPMLRFELAERSVTVVQTGGIEFLEAVVEYPIEVGDFPRLRKLLAVEPKKPATVTAVNAAYLSAFKDAPRDGEPLVLHMGEPNKPMRITCGDYFIGLLMPTRDGGAGLLLETWLDLLTAGTGADK